MPTFSKRSLEILREKMDIVSVISSCVALRPKGATLTACCPFHEEKTPSFVVKRGDTHYHCYGCGAHGDAIQFMMEYHKMGFVEAVEKLAEMFHVPLEEKSEREYQGPSKALLKDVVASASRFYQAMLLYTKEGEKALEYLYNRGLDLHFIRTYGIGFAPSHPRLFQAYMEKKQIAFPLLEKAGLMKRIQGQKERDFFSGRIMIPILSRLGEPIGFTGRKISDQIYGPKYINTPETPLFKKSHVLFGLSYCRKEIASTKKALLVEGQIDALRLIHAGFAMTVAPQGTAFTEDQVKELKLLGVETVYIAFDADEAGQNSAEKAGSLLQKAGIAVYVIELMEGMDPDTILLEKGPKYWQKLIDEAKEYLSFLFIRKRRGKHLESPAEKTHVIEEVAAIIRSWENSLMVHESLRSLAKIADVPDWTLGLEAESTQIEMQKSGSVIQERIDPDRVLEAEFLRWLLSFGETHPELIYLAKRNLQLEDLKGKSARILFSLYLEQTSAGKTFDLLSLMVELKDDTHKFLEEILNKKVDPTKAVSCMVHTIQKILERRWMEKREAVKQKIVSGTLEEEEALELAKEFDELKKNMPEVHTEIPGEEASEEEFLHSSDL